MGNCAYKRGIRERELFITYVILIALAEVATSFIDPSYGMFFHFVILVSLLAISTLKYMGNPSSGLFLSLSLAPLIRVVSLSLPLIYFPRYVWYVVASVPVLASTLILMRVQGMDLCDAGVNFKKPLAQALTALTGIPFGFIEYHILKPEPLAVGLSLTDLILLAIALVFSTGFVEELVFRGVIQRNATKALRDKMGVVGVTAVFASLHIGWLSLLDVIFVFSIGLFFGFLTLKTGSIVGVSLSHGITNVVLFQVMPFLTQNL